LYLRNVSKGKDTSKKTLGCLRLKMPKRKFDAKLRKVGNSSVVTIPKDTVARFNLNEGDFLALELDTNEIKRRRKGKS